MKRRKLSTLLGLNYFIILLIPLTVMGIAFFTLITDSLNQAIIKKNRDIIFAIKQELNIITDQVESDLDYLHGLLDGNNVREDKLEDSLKVFLDKSALYESLQILDGNLRVASLSPQDPSLLGSDQSGHDFIVMAQGQEGFSWSNSFISPFNYHLTEAVAKRYGNHTLVLYLNLNEIIPSLIANHNEESSYAFILDDRGIIIGHPDEKRVNQRETMRHIPAVMEILSQGFSKETVHGDDQSITLFSALDSPAWIVGYYQGGSEAFYQIRYLRNIFWGASLVILVAALLFSILNIKRTVAPLISLLKATRNVTEGRYSPMDKTGQASLEISQLMDQFAQMMGAIENREGQLNRLRKFLFSTIDSMPSLLIGLDRDLRITLWNGKARIRTGWDRNQVRGKQLKDVLPSYEDLEDSVKRTIESREIGHLKERESEQEGIKIYEDITIYPLTGENTEEGVVVRLDNVTERVYMERRVVQTEKLSSLGGLTAGMAHDLNNLLTPILGYGELIMMNLSGESEIKTSLEQIREAAESAQEMVRQLLAFSRKAPINPSLVNLDGIIKKFSRLLRRTIRENVIIRYDLEEIGDIIKGDKGQIEQIIMNLAVNAQYAMPEGGSLSLSTKRVRISEKDQSHPGMKPGEYVCLTVEDTGVGMDEETIKQIFDPFFTTKENEGTGLGLATVYGIVQQHRGFIWVYSEPGMGTSFKIHFPRTGKVDAPPGITMEEMSEKKYEREGTVILAEDNRQVRRLVKEILEKLGFRVEGASMAEEALAIGRDIKNRGEQPVLLLTDLVMPGMNGKDLYRRLEEILPGLKVIFMSGYSRDLIDMTDDSASPFIQKPFDVTSLKKKIREVCGQDMGSD